jgi:putative ABC transport system permease protein
MRSMLAVKLRRDLCATWSRFALMVIAIAVSLMVFGGVLLAFVTSNREVPNAYMGTEPASATILLDNAIPAAQMNVLVNAVRNRPGVIQATGRTQFTSQVQVNGQPRETPLQVFVAAPDDPMWMAKFDVQSGNWPPAPGKIFIGRDTFSLLQLAVGDTLTLAGPSGATLHLQVAASVYDPSLAPAPQEQTGHAYLSSASLVTSADQPVLDQLKILVDEVATPGVPSRNRDAIVATASDIAQWLGAERGMTVREVQTPEPYAHPHQWQANSLLLALLSGGLVALVLSTLLVANMLNRLFTQQIPQIGIMKAIGAQTGDILRFYVALTLLVAAVATLLALLPSIVIGRALLNQMFGFLGIQPVSVGAPWWTYAVIVVVGVALPPLMALPPLVGTSRTTVRAAIDHHGTSSNPNTAGGMLAQFTRLPGLDRGFVMALRNTLRRPARFFLAVGLLASAGSVFVAGLSLSSGVQAIADQQAQQLTWDVDVQLADPAPVEQLTGLLAGLPQVRSVEGWSRVQTGLAGVDQLPITRTYPDQGHGGVSVTAFPANTTTLVRPKLVEGRWLQPAETGAIVLNQIARDTAVPNIHAGDSVQLLTEGQSTTWQVVGIAQEMGPHGGSGGVYATAEGFAAGMSQAPLVNQLRITTQSHDEQTRAAVAVAAQKSLTDAGVGVTSAASVSRREAITAGHLAPLIAIVLAIAIVMGVVGVIGLASTMSANVLDRTREFGVMHAIGAPPARVRRIVTAEGVFLSLASVVVAVLPTVLLTLILGAGLGNLFLYAPLPFRISAIGAVIWIVLVILGAILATEAAASRAARLTVREALAYL